MRTQSDLGAARPDWKALFAAEDLTQAEKKYIFDFQYRHAGDFMRTLYEAIHRADLQNRARLAKGFPEEVAAVVAWMEGDLAQRAEKYGVD